MESDLEGRIRNTRVSLNSGLNAMFEAVVNSIQAMPNPSNGKIIIKIINCVKPLDDGVRKRPKRDGFIIIDDGVGFNENNYRSFCMLDSQFKASLGCKGIGRLSWLKVFQRVNVKSVFEKDGKKYRREFTFSIEDGVSGGDEIVETNDPVSTVVELCECRPEYQEAMPVTLKAISSRIFDHCMSFFLSEKAPSIKIEQDNNEPEFVNDLLDLKIGDNVESESFNFGGYEFDLKHVRLYKCAKECKSGISLCANGLEVLQINNINITPMDDSGKTFRYICYVSSKLLDERVNNSRDGFDLGSNERRLEDWDTVPSLEDIKKEIMKYCNLYLEGYSANYKNKCKECMKKFNETEIGKSFGSVIRYDPDLVNYITPDMTDEQMFDIYSKSQAKIESSVLFKPDRDNNRKIDDVDLIESELEKVNQIQKDQLIRMILHRNIILNTYRNRLDAINDECGDDNEKLLFEREDLIHNLLLPKGTDTRDRLIYESCNLWMLDEKLNHYAYINKAYSDKKIGDMHNVDIDLRPDIVIFGDMGNDECANSIAIIELKRPSRSDTTIIDQIFEYVMQIESGLAKDHCGQTIKVHEGTTYYCFAICDVTSANFKKLMKKWQFKPQFGGNSYFKWHDEFNASIEVIDHVKLVSDARLRNEVFFKMIGVSINKDDVIVEKGKMITVKKRNKC